MAVAMALVLVVGLRTAWVSDDAEITLRSVLNFVHGYGPNYNIDERVQAYTHPLWFLIVSLLGLSGINVFIIVIGLGIACTLVVIALLFRISWSPWLAAALVGVLVFSKAFVDYMTSGLENPLSHVLVLAAILMGIRALAATATLWDPLLAFLFVGLLFLSRPDLPLLLAPLAVVVLLRTPLPWRRRWLTVIPGVVVVLAWMTFSTIYYGFPFPNTAYAKLGVGISHFELALQGLRYLVDSLTRDPITLLAIGAAIVLAVAGRRIVDLAIAAGILLYLGYIVWIGGDFMSGRFVTAPLVASVAILARVVLTRTTAMSLGALGVLLAVIGAPRTLLSDGSYSNKDFGPWGVTDERGFYFDAMGLIAPEGSHFDDDPGWPAGLGGVTDVEAGCGKLGWIGISRGPSVHVVDSCGLADAFIARLPRKPSEGWRAGHFERAVPAGYLTSVRLGENHLVDPELHAYYDKIQLIVRGDIWSPERWQAIFDLNLGRVRAPTP